MSAIMQEQVRKQARDIVHRYAGSKHLEREYPPLERLGTGRWAFWIPVRDAPTEWRARLEESA